MKVEILKRNGEVEYMSIDEFSRWMCLIEAFEIICEKANYLKVDMQSMIKPLAIENYIKERFDAMKHDVSCEIAMGIL